MIMHGGHNMPFRLFGIVTRILPDGRAILRRLDGGKER
jgi:hypothetical protein